MIDSSGDPDPVYNTATVGASSILLVDDTYVLRERLSVAMQQRGFRVETAGNYEEAVDTFSARPTELAVLDLRMPGKSGLELLRSLLNIQPDTRVIMLSGFGSIPASIDAVRAGAVNFLSKPADADDILSAFVRGDSPSVPEGHAFRPSQHIPKVLRKHVCTMLCASEIRREWGRSRRCTPS